MKICWDTLEKYGLKLNKRGVLVDKTSRVVFEKESCIGCGEPYLTFIESQEACSMECTQRKIPHSKLSEDTILKIVEMYELGKEVKCISNNMCINFKTITNALETFYGKPYKDFSRFNSIEVANAECLSKRDIINLAKAKRRVKINGKYYYAMESCSVCNKPFISLNKGKSCSLKCGKVAEIITKNSNRKFNDENVFEKENVVVLKDLNLTQEQIEHYLNEGLIIRFEYRLRYPRKCSGCNKYYITNSITSKFYSKGCGSINKKRILNDTEIARLIESFKNGKTKNDIITSFKIARSYLNEILNSAGVSKVDRRNITIKDFGGGQTSVSDGRIRAVEVDRHTISSEEILRILELGKTAKCDGNYYHPIASCKICNKPFLGHSSTSIICSKECQALNLSMSRERAFNRRYKSKFKYLDSLDLLGDEIVQLANEDIKLKCDGIVYYPRHSCGFCKKPFIALSSTTVFCSAICRKHARNGKTLESLGVEVIENESLIPKELVGDYDIADYNKSYVQTMKFLNSSQFKRLDDMTQAFIMGEMFDEITEVFTFEVPKKFMTDEEVKFYAQKYLEDNNYRAVNFVNFDSYSRKITYEVQKYQ